MRNIDLPQDGQSRNMNYELERIRKLVKTTDNDGFYRRNSSLSMLLGTILMWIALAHVSSGISLQISNHVKQSTQVFINFMLAGCGGGIGSFLSTKLF